jgi:hypothetical protein
MGSSLLAEAMDLMGYGLFLDGVCALQRLLAGVAWWRCSEGCCYYIVLAAFACVNLHHPALPAW